MELEVFELKNGIRVVHQQSFGTDVAHFGLLINVGTRDEEDHEQGLAHFIEHVIFKGTKKRKAHHILSRLDAVGGELNAYTTKEDTVLYTSFLKSHYNRAFELVSDIIYNSQFPPNELEKEKEVIYDEINSYLDNPSEQIFDDFEGYLFENHPLGKNILGTKKHLKTFNRKMVHAFMKKHYHAQNMVIASTGPASAKRIFALAEKYFSEVPSSSNNHRSSLDFIPVQKEISLEKDLMQSHCILGTSSYSATHKYKTGMVLLSNYLGGPAMNSKLNMEIREKNGYTYNIEASYSPFTDTGLFSIYYGTDAKYTGRVDKLIRKQLDLLTDKKMGVNQLHMAKQQLIGQIALSQENKVNLMLALGKSLLLYDRVDTIQEVYDQITAVTAEDIIEIANENLSPKLLSSLYYLPKN